MTNNSSRIKATVRRVAFEVVEECIPEESDLFGIAWARFESGREPSIGVGGLPVHGDESAEVLTPFVIMIVAAVCESLLVDEVELELTEIASAVRCAAQSLKLQDERASHLADAIAPRLHSAYLALRAPTVASAPRQAARGGKVIGTADVESCGKNRPTIAYVRTLIADECSRQDGLSLTEARRLCEQNSWDLVIDEFAGTIQVSACGEPQIILKVPRRQRAFLWLILQNIGKQLSYQYIERAFGLLRVDESSARNHRVHQYRRELSKLLGEQLRDRVIYRSCDEQYPIQTSGWTFLWIRRDRDPQRSDLCFDVAGISAAECQ